MQLTISKRVKRVGGCRTGGHTQITVRYGALSDYRRHQMRF
jgi:hypothetical protein